MTAQRLASFGTKRYRNYGRELKNGMGLSLIDLLIQRKLETQIRMDMELMSKESASEKFRGSCSGQNMPTLSSAHETK